MRYLNSQEVIQMLAAIHPRDFYAIRDRSLVLLPLHTGLRVGELIKLNIGHVALNGIARQTLHVTSMIGKCRHERLVPLNAIARQIIESLVSFKANHGFSVAAHTPLFVTETGTRIPIRAVQYVIARLRKRSGIDVMATPHTLRHTMLTNLVGKCGNVRVAQAIAGHKRLNTTQQYLHPSREQLQAAVDQLVG